MLTNGLVKKHQKIVLLLVFIYLILFILFLFTLEIAAFPNISPETLGSLPVNPILLDDDSLNELIYISSDFSILVFRRATFQLLNLNMGDALFLDYEITKDDYFLGQIINIIRDIRDNSYQNGMIIHLVPWRENHPPVISGLIAQPSILEAGQQSRVTCHAADEDGDTLSYYWYSNKGLIRGIGASVIWTAPYQPGDCFISCEVSDNRGGKDNRAVRIQVVKSSPLLTYQERELIYQFGWSSNHTIRWPDGPVAVYDGTNFHRMQEVLDEWNKVVGDNVLFYLSNDPQSPVKISYNYELSRKNLCYHVDTHWRNYQLYAAEIQVNPDSWQCGFPGNLYAGYLHSFSGVAGFNVWQGKTIERRDWQNFNQISEIMRNMIKGLYKVPAGYDLNND
ncbi:MAG TPA: hypothetical protein PKJ95_03225 [Atribacterota bacterium]|nr:hypothetical protein [Atribacterota bacterium]